MFIWKNKAVTALRHGIRPAFEDVGGPPEGKGVGDFIDPIAVGLLNVSSGEIDIVLFRFTIFERAKTVNHCRLTQIPDGISGPVDAEYKAPLGRYTGSQGVVQRFSPSADYLPIPDLPIAIQEPVGRTAQIDAADLGCPQEAGFRMHPFRAASPLG